MPEPVIVATARSPIGRAFKGSLAGMRPDDLAAQMVTALLDKVPQLPKDQIDDLMMGCGSPAGEQGFNVARVTSLLAGLQAPGVTVNRYCSSSLQTIRMAAHAIKAGEGDAFIAAGVECVSRYGNGASDSPTAVNALFAAAMERSAERVARRPGRLGARRRPARHLHRDGPDGRERPRARGRHAPGDGRVRRAAARSGPWRRSTTASSSARSCR